MNSNMLYLIVFIYEHISTAYLCRRNSAPCSHSFVRLSAGPRASRVLSLVCDPRTLGQRRLWQECTAVPTTATNCFLR